ncbi:hypothetical protein PR048_004730 [Dryococelus australis]|uniref:DDE-1 domain-containing protein n=1 Tax=Dryococelus australis TaxID=614101 RepID=A0ABQ9I785_9NEOP|nr:hypothetical protein PR048_004730 [Dryococelus australis]
MTGELFYEFMTNIFHPKLVEKNISLPVVLFIDGHLSHLTLHTSKFCDEHGIILVALLPNATYILQPMDVGVFRLLKNGWKKAVHECLISKIQMPSIIPFVLKKLQNALPKCGIYPWDPSVIDTNKKIAKSSTLPDVTSPRSLHISCDTTGISQELEKFLGKEKLSQVIIVGDVWNGDVRDTSLFEFW